MPKSSRRFYEEEPIVNRNNQEIRESHMTTKATAAAAVKPKPGDSDDEKIVCAVFLSGIPKKNQTKKDGTFRSIPAHVAREAHYKEGELCDHDCGGLCQ
ncbi:MAG: hypothetical protein Q7S04_04010 [Candidatus Moranbacteria bacterium]|nr:hypothetical protein [Candidatus Moranbacteria bacterium]